jgi:hypothetical protein
MATTPDENIVKLYVAPDSRVWYSVGIGPPINSAQTVDEFLFTPVIHGLSHVVRVIGVAQNAELISALYLRRNNGEIRGVEIAGPNILHAPEELQEPSIVLSRMRSVDIASAAGGWHSISMRDYPTYAMLARMMRNNFVFDESAETYFTLHPARKALLFIPGVSEAEAAKLMTTIVDPRWYVDRRSPERAAKLELYLGLTPQTQTRVSDAKCILTKTREFRCQNVLAVWKTQDADTVDLQNPANFLYRIRKAARSGAKGDLRASQAFIRYLRYNWLAAIETRPGVRDGLFVPDMFFKTPAECAAYAEHMSTK